MRKLIPVLILGLFIFWGMVVSSVYAEPTITVEFTTHDYEGGFDGPVVTDFDVYEPVLYKAVYTVVSGVGDPDEYKAKLIFKGFGQKLIFKRKVTDGTYEERWALLVPGRFADKISYPIERNSKVKIKLKELGTSDGFPWASDRETVPIRIWPEGP